MNQADLPSAQGLAESRRAIEAMLLVATDPTPEQLLAQLVELPSEVVGELCQQLAAEYEAQERGFQLVEVAGGWRYQTHPDLHAYVERYALEGIPNRLSNAALETLAIVAYKQPVSRAQIGAIRGVNVDAVLRTLALRGYVEEHGKDDGPGQATLFGTTSFFLEQLGLASTKDLPSLGDFVPSAAVLEALEQTLRIDGDAPVADDQPVDLDPEAEDGAVCDDDSDGEPEVVDAEEDVELGPSSGVGVTETADDDEVVLDVAPGAAVIRVDIEESEEDKPEDGAATDVDSQPVDLDPEAEAEPELEVRAELEAEPGLKVEVGSDLEPGVEAEDGPSCDDDFDGEPEVFDAAPGAAVIRVETEVSEEHEPEDGSAADDAGTQADSHVDAEVDSPFALGGIGDLMTPSGPSGRETQILEEALVVEEAQVGEDEPESVDADQAPDRGEDLDSEPVLVGEDAPALVLDDLDVESDIDLDVESDIDLTEEPAVNDEPADGNAYRRILSPRSFLAGKFPRVRKLMSKLRWRRSKRSSWNQDRQFNWNPA